MKNNENISFLGEFPSREKMENLSINLEKLIDKYKGVKEEIDLYNSLIEIKESFEYIEKHIR